MYRYLSISLRWLANCGHRGPVIHFSDIFPGLDFFNVSIVEIAPEDDQCRYTFRDTERNVDADVIDPYHQVDDVQEENRFPTSNSYVYLLQEKSYLSFLLTCQPVLSYEAGTSSGTQYHDNLPRPPPDDSPKLA